MAGDSPLRGDSAVWHGVLLTAALTLIAVLASAQPVPPLPTVTSLDLVPPGPPTAPATAPESRVLALGVSFGPGQWRRVSGNGLAGRVVVDLLPSGLTRLRLEPVGGGPSVDFRARLPIETDELATFLGAPGDGRFREIVEPGPGDLRQRLQVSTAHAGLEILEAEVPTPAAFRLPGIEVTQHHSDRAHGNRSSGWDYPVPVTVQTSGASAELWQGQATQLGTTAGSTILVAVMTSTVAKPRGVARHLLESDPYVLKMVVIYPR